MDLPHRYASPDVGPLARACIDACNDCAALLRRHARDGARSAPASAADRAIWQSMLDCAETCEATALMLRGDPAMVPRIVDACALLCDGCADELAANTDDPSLRASADAARRCASCCVALVATRVPVAVRQPLLRA